MCVEKIISLLTTANICQTKKKKKIQKILLTKIFVECFTSAGGFQRILSFDATIYTIEII